MLHAFGRHALGDGKIFIKQTLVLLALCFGQYCVNVRLDFTFCDFKVVETGAVSVRQYSQFAGTLLNFFD